MERTIRECLLMQTRDELADAALRLGLEPLKHSARKAEWAEHIECMLPERMENLVLQMRVEEIDAVSARLARGLTISVDENADDAEQLVGGLMTLKRYGMAWRDGQEWRVRACVADMLTLDEDRYVEQRLHDLLTDVMNGWLLHVGMMPMDELLARTAALMEPSPEERDGAEGLCEALWVSRHGLLGLCMADDGVEWAVSEDVEDREALLERLREPAIAALPYPDFPEEALVQSAETLLPGDVKLYIPLLDWLEEHDCDDAAAALEDAACIIQNDRVSEAVELICECCEPDDEKDMHRMARLVFELSNRMPRWCNKGHTPEEMLGAAQRQKAAMPGRNDPCTCGSGKKYKNCCGRRVN